MVVGDHHRRKPFLPRHSAASRATISWLRARPAMPWVHRPGAAWGASPWPGDPDPLPLAADSCPAGCGPCGPSRPTRAAAWVEGPGAAARRLTRRSWSAAGERRDEDPGLEPEPDVCGAGSGTLARLRAARSGRGIATEPESGGRGPGHRQERGLAGAGRPTTASSSPGTMSRLTSSSARTRRSRSPAPYDVATDRAGATVVASAGGRAVAVIAGSQGVGVDRCARSAPRRPRRGRRGGEPSVSVMPTAMGATPLQRERHGVRHHASPEPDPHTQGERREPTSSRVAWVRPSRRSRGRGDDRPAGRGDLVRPLDRAEV